MTDLSPQTQAIVDAFDVEYYQKAKKRYDALAAVLRILIDEIVPEDFDHWDDGRDDEFWNGLIEFGQKQRNEYIRLQVLKIIKELENV